MTRAELLARLESYMHEKLGRCVRLNAACDDMHPDDKRALAARLGVDASRLRLVGPPWMVVLDDRGLFEDP